MKFNLLKVIQKVLFLIIFILILNVCGFGGVEELDIIVLVINVQVVDIIVWVQLDVKFDIFVIDNKDSIILYMLNCNVGEILGVILSIFNVNEIIDISC